MAILFKKDDEAARSGRRTREGPVGEAQPTKKCPVCSSDQAVVRREGVFGERGEHICGDCSYRFFVLGSP